MKKFIYFLFTSMLAVFMITGCGGNPMESVPPNGKIKVVTSFDAMKALTETIGGDKVSVTAVIPDGTEPHDFEPKAEDIRQIGKADLFVYNGFGMEPWAGKAIKAVNNPKLHVVEASKGADSISITDEEEKKEHGAIDPHLWLSPKGGEIEAANIRDALIEMDPKDKEYFTSNYDKFHSDMEAMYTEYNQKFADAPRHEIVTGHAAFAYLCRDFGLTQDSVEDVFASGEPGTKRMTELIDFCKAHQVKTVFVEDMVSPNVSQTIANEAGADVQKIYTMEGSENGKSYTERMKENLQLFYEGLK